MTHTQGYNPRPSVSIALPLSVGVESVCELLDFELEGESVDGKTITARLNEALVPGIQVLRTYDNGAKLKNLALLSTMVTMEYDQGVPAGAQEAITELFSRETLVVEKKGKNGPTQQDLIPMIRSLEVKQADAHQLQIHALVCCQNPSLNPAQLVAAIQLYLPEYAPDFAKNCRLDLFTAEQKRFR